jgi:hypothetical protein
VVGFFALVAGIPVTALTYSETLCKPTPQHSCDGYHALSWGLIGGGAALMVSGIVLTSIGRAFRIRSYFGGLELHAPKLALLPAEHGGVGGAVAALDFTF